MKRIKLTQNKYTVVDDVDYENLKKFRWYVGRNRNKYYAQIAEKVNGKWVTVMMHRKILGNPNGIVDHINRDGLDNRRANLRITDSKGNARNRGLSSKNKSGYKGVYFEKNINKWRPGIYVNGKILHLGSYNSVKEAAKVYNDNAKKYYKSFAYLNTIYDK